MARVLMIDDDKDMCEEMTDILGSAGIEVTAVCDPAKGLKLTQAKKYDLFLIDLKMPKITGYEILRSIKDRDMKIKVMVITGAPLNGIAGIESNGEEKYRQEILKLADEVVNKPVDIEYVIQKIRELTGE
jgi:CheY-like chemotaxis protein